MGMQCFCAGGLVIDILTTLFVYSVVDGIPVCFWFLDQLDHQPYIILQPVALDLALDLVLSVVDGWWC